MLPLRKFFIMFGHRLLQSKHPLQHSEIFHIHPCGARDRTFTNACLYTTVIQCGAYKVAKRVDVKKKVEEKLGNSIGKCGVTICCDGWDNVQNQSLLNMVQCGTNRNLFLGTIDTTGNHKDHQYVAGQIRPFLEKVKVHNVLQVCMDNAPVMTIASRHILQSTSHLYVQRCTAHCLDLLLEDWNKEE